MDVSQVLKNLSAIGWLQIDNDVLVGHSHSDVYRYHILTVIAFVCYVNRLSARPSSVC